MPHTQPRGGFSLVELSIVLVILGLLVGGILGGQSLIRAAELRSITTELDAYTAAVYTFRNKYSALPGDFRHAARIWGEAPNCPGTAAQGTTDGTTCDGNGDGSITLNNEPFRFWQHLSNAGIISGQFTGVRGAGGVLHALIGENIPASRLNGGGWSAYSLDSFAGDHIAFAMNYGNTFRLGAQTTTDSALGPLLPPQDLWSIDSKIDDGMPAKGKVIAGNRQTCTDSDDETDLDADYDLANEAIACMVYFRNAF